MARKRISALVKFAFALMIVLFCSNSVIAAAPIPFTTLLGGEITISERESSEYSPAIAYNSVHDQYLVVWENQWGSGPLAHHDIYGQRLSSSGKVLSWFAIATSINSQVNPDVSYDWVNDRYLVVWSYDAYGTGGDWDIYGRFIPWNGPDPSLTDFVICNWPLSNQGNPAVTYAYSQGEFLVSWRNQASGIPSYISARRVFAGGGFPPGDGFTVASGPKILDFPDVAYNLARNEYLVVYDKEFSASDLDIFAQRLNGAGILLGGEITITYWPHFEAFPAVAACDKADQYMIVWQSDQGTAGADYAIYARYLNGDAVPGNIYLVDDSNTLELNAAVSCDDTGRRYLLAWQSGQNQPIYEIWARMAYPNEYLDMVFNIVSRGPSQNREYPAIAGGRSNYLVAWEHERYSNNNRDIHGQVVGYGVFMPFIQKVPLPK